MTSPTPSEPRTGQKLYHATALKPANAWIVFFAATLTIWITQGVAYGMGAPGLVAAGVSYVVALCIFIGIVRTEGVAIVGLRWPQARYVLAAVLVGIAAWYVNLVIVSLLEPPGSDSKTLKQIVEQSPLVTTVLVVGVLPAVVEELVFRGVLARSLATRYSPAIGIGISAVLFGLYHIVPAQMVSTFFLGLALAFITLRARSVVPAMIVHFLNNSIAIVVSREELPWLGKLLLGNPLPVLACAIASVATGITIAARGRHE